jgi:carbon storage regulator
MLVLSRRIGEEIVIADNIHLTVVAIKKNQVRLGITAPASVGVARQELLAECSGADSPQSVGTNGENQQSRDMRL